MDYHRLQDRTFTQTDPDVLEQRGGGGCVSIFGIPFLLAGLFVLQIPFGLVPVEAGGGPVALAIAVPLGFIFAVVGGVLVFGRNGVAIDRRRRIVVKWWGLLLPMRRAEHQLDLFDRVRMDFTSGDSDSSDAYPISLTGGPGTAKLPLIQPTDYRQARKTAEEIARFINKPLEDVSAGKRVVREAAELDEPLARRLKHRGRTAVSLPAPPAAMASTIEEAPEGMTITIPPRPPGPFRFVPLLFGIVLATVVFYFFVLPLLVLPGPPLFRYGLAAFASLFFVAGPVVSGLRLLWRASKNRTVVTVSRTSITVQTTVQGKTGVAEMPINTLEELELPTRDSALEAAEVPPGHMAEGFGNRGGPRLRDGRPLPPWMGWITRFYASPGITARSDEASIAFGRGLPEDELVYLHARIMRFLSSLP
jgi:hypothetical protein